MYANTCFNNCSEYGYKNNELKSGICKYMRRNEHEKFLWCIMELSKFHNLNNKGGNSIITNMLNRLKILLMEDFSCLEIDRIYNSIMILEEYEKDKSNIYLLMKFSNIILNGNKNRVCSYINNWWKNKHDTLNIQKIVINKCLKYKLENDTDELLILGENLINYIESKDEKLFAIYMKMIQLKGKMGNRYRRKDPVYLYWVIMRDYMKNEKMIKIFDFALDRFINKNMKERYYFGIWIGLMIWKEDMLDYNIYEYQNFCKEDEIEYYKNMNKIELDDYVLKDYHVNKNYGLDKFAKIGAYVKDEDLKILGEKSLEYKNYYIESKKKDTKNIDNKEIIEYIDWNEFEIIKIIEEGVCCGKIPCLIVKYNNKKKVLKEMTKSLNYGKDYIVIDKCKKLFGLKDLNMIRIKSNKGLVKISKKNTYVNNCKIDNKECIYCMMDYWDNIGDLGKNKDKLKDIKIVEECLKIRYFDGLFKSSDNIIRNILINNKGELMSIDEGDMFGKRKYILNMNNDWCRNNCDKKLIDKIIDNFINNKEYFKKEVNKIMLFYNLNFCKEFNERIDNYKAIVDYEWDIY